MFQCTHSFPKKKKKNFTCLQRFPRTFSEDSSSCLRCPRSAIGCLVCGKVLSTSEPRLGVGQPTARCSLYSIATLREETTNVIIDFNRFESRDKISNNSRDLENRVVAVGGGCQRWSRRRPLLSSSRPNPSFLCWPSIPCSRAIPRELLAAWRDPRRDSSLGSSRTSILSMLFSSKRSAAGKMPGYFEKKLRNF